MKSTHEKTVKVTFELNEMEAIALAQLCIQVRGESGLRRSFYGDVWSAVRDALGDVPASAGVFRHTADGIYCVESTPTGSPAGGSK